MDTLRRIRTMRGMNQVELAEASGVAQNTISEIELGKREARPATLKKLADALGVEIAEFFPDYEAPKAPAPPSSQQTLFNNGVLEEERRYPSLQGWADLINRFADRWEQEITERESEWQVAKPAIRKHVKLLPNLSWANEIRQTASDVLDSAHEQLQAAILDVRNSDEARKMFTSAQRLQDVLERTDPWYRRGAEDAPEVAEVVDFRAVVKRIERQIGSQAS